MGTQRKIARQKSMKNNVNLKKINKYRCDGCKQDGYCVKYLMSKDSPNMMSNLGFRCIYTLIAWIIIAIDVSNGTGVFTSLIMFSLPLLYDYIKFTPDGKLRKIIKDIGIGLSILWMIIGIIGQKGAFEIIQIKSLYYIHTSSQFVFLPNINFQYLYLLLLISLSVILTFADMFTFKNKAEDILFAQFGKAISEM